MLTIRTVWLALVNEVKSIESFKDVRPYPLHKINDAAFLKDFPGLKFPACLVVRLGKQDTANGQALERVTNWSFVIIDRDPSGEAWMRTVELEDAVSEILDQQVLNGEVTINAGNEVAIAYTNPRFSVIEISATTREVGRR